MCDFITPFCEVVICDKRLKKEAYFYAKDSSFGIWRRNEFTGDHR